MIGVEQLAVHVDMFNPEPTPRGAQLLQETLHRLTGEPGAELMAGIRSGSFDRFNIPQDLRDRTNTYFLRALAGELRIPPGLNPPRFWKNREVDATDLHFYIRDRLPNLGRNLGIANEATTATGDISDTLEVLASEDLPVRYRHEMRRRMLVGLVSAAIEVDGMECDLQRELRKIESIFAQHLFVGKQADTQPHTVYAYHDNKTNAVVSLSTSFDLGEPADTTSKRHAFETREIGKVGKVFYDSREKARPSVLAKAVDRAYLNGGFINPFKDVEDRFGVIFVIMDPSIKPAYLSNKIKGILGKYYRPIESDKRDDKPKNDRDQLGDVKMHRTRYRFTGVPTPFEAMIFRIEDFINYQCEVGIIDELTGFYNGPARQLYEVRRLRGSLDTGYPQGEVYYQFDPARAIAQRIEELVPGIRDIGIYADPKPVNLADVNKISGNGSINGLLAH